MSFNFIRFLLVVFVLVVEVAVVVVVVVAMLQCHVGVRWDCVWVCVCAQAPQTIQTKYAMLCGRCGASTICYGLYFFFGQSLNGNIVMRCVIHYTTNIILYLKI